MEHSEGLTREVYVTLESPSLEFADEEIRDLAYKLAAFHSVNDVIHLDQIMEAMRSPLGFSFHYGSYIDGTFSTEGQAVGAPGPHEHDRVMPLRYTFWLSHDLYGHNAGDGLTEIHARRGQLEKIDLGKPGLYPEIENQVPPYMSRPPS